MSPHIIYVHMILCKGLLQIASRCNVFRLSTQKLAETSARLGVRPKAPLDSQGRTNQGGKLS